MVHKVENFVSETKNRDTFVKFDGMYHDFLMLILFFNHQFFNS